MGSIGFPELALILVIVLVIFGASRLPEIGRGLGKAISNFKTGMKEGAEETGEKKLGSSAQEKEK
ncbi:MAG TPA: twin-arginine translocase TatA/TatE family subunit [Acidobacteriota bacterium]|nr:twin-arginine translocase TatA/TatE family subunit [Acidobacteriota bacterium]